MNMPRIYVLRKYSREIKTAMDGLRYHIRDGDSVLSTRPLARAWCATGARLQLQHPGQLGGHRWYVVFTQPNREFHAQMQLAAQGFRSFVPRYRKTVRHARKLKTVSAPFFPRYLFVALDL